MASLVLGIIAIRRGNRRAHVGHMVGSYFGLVVAFVWAAAVPSRTVAQVVAEAPFTAAAAGLLAVLTALGALWVYGRIPTAPRPPTAARQLSEATRQ